MRIDPLVPKSPVAVIARTARVTRSSVTLEEDLGSEDDMIAEVKPRPRRRRFFATTNAASHASPAVLSALIDLQAKSTDAD